MQLIPIHGPAGRPRGAPASRASATAPPYYELTPEAWIERLVDAGARRIHLVDLDGAFGGARQRLLRPVPEALSRARFQLGGGLRSRAGRGAGAAGRLRRGGGHPGRGAPASTAGPGPGRPGRRGPGPAQGGRWCPRLARPPQSPAPPRMVFEALLDLGITRALVTDVNRDGAMDGPGLEAAALGGRPGLPGPGLRRPARPDDLEMLRPCPGWSPPSPARPCWTDGSPEDPRDRRPPRKEPADGRETHHPLPGRQGRPRGQGHPLQGPARHRATRRSWRVRYDLEGADELVFLDIAASNEGRTTREAWVRGGGPGRSASPSRSAAGSPAWTASGACCGPGPTRSP